MAKRLFNHTELVCVASIEQEYRVFLKCRTVVCYSAVGSERSVDTGLCKLSASGSKALFDVEVDRLWDLFSKAMKAHRRIMTEVPVLVDGLHKFKRTDIAQRVSSDWPREFQIVRLELSVLFQELDELLECGLLNEAPESSVH